MLSPSGALAAWQCDGHVSIVSVPDATVIADLETWARVLGFDRHDAGIILAGEDMSGSFDALAYWILDGEVRALVDAYFEFGTPAIVEWPYYDLAP